MAITRALMNRQMYNMGGPTLEAGAPDLRLTGDQRNRGTYTQRRRNQMADGGIASMRDRIKYNVGPGETLVGKPGGLVEPGVKQYGLLSKIKDKIVDDLIPNEIKENPMLTAVAGGALLNQFGLPPFITEPLSLSDQAGQNWLGELLGGIPGVPDDLNLVIGDDRDLLGRLITGSAGTTGGIDRLTGDISDYIIGGGIGGTGMEGSPELAGQLRNLINYTTGMEGSPELASNKAGLSNLITAMTGGATDWAKQQIADRFGIQRATAQPKVRWMEPLAIGLGIGALDKATREDHQLPADLSINIPQTAQAAMDDPNLRFKPPLEATQLAADGGRIGYFRGGPLVKKGIPLVKKRITEALKKFKRPIFSYDDEVKMIMDLTETKKYTQDELMALDGDQLFEIYVREGFTPPKAIPQADETINLKNITPKIEKAKGGRIGYSIGKAVDPKPRDQMKEIEGQMAGPQWWWDRVQHLEFLGYSHEQASQIAMDDDKYFEIVGGRAQGGRIGAQEGGLMDLGGMEKDYRQEGGFVPIGGEEKADDVPARLSKNEFVFTADAVRSAGGGDIDEGAAVMERLMENLEAGGKVSEESQGLEGAREMFATAQQLEKRII